MLFNFLLNLVISKTASKNCLFSYGFCIFFKFSTSELCSTVKSNGHEELALLFPVPNIKYIMPNMSFRSSMIPNFNFKRISYEVIMERELKSRSFDTLWKSLDQRLDNEPW